jgi:hypothetical protein
MSPKKTMLVAALSVLALCSCGTPQTKANFPTPPELLMRQPADLKDTKLKDSPVLSDVEAQHVRETTLFREVREQLVGLQNWVRKMQSVDAK